MPASRFVGALRLVATSLRELLRAVVGLPPVAPAFSASTRVAAEATSNRITVVLP